MEARIVVQHRAFLQNSFAPTPRPLAPTPRPLACLPGPLRISNHARATVAGLGKMNSCPVGVSGDLRPAIDANTFLMRDLFLLVLQVILLSVDRVESGAAGTQTTTAGTPPPFSILSGDKSVVDKYYAQEEEADRELSGGSPTSFPTFSGSAGSYTSSFESYKGDGDVSGDGLWNTGVKFNQWVVQSGTTPTTITGPTNAYDGSYYLCTYYVGSSKSLLGSLPGLCMNPHRLRDERESLRHI